MFSSLRAGKVDKVAKMARIKVKAEESHFDRTCCYQKYERDDECVFPGNASDDKNILGRLVDPEVDHLGEIQAILQSNPGTGAVSVLRSQ